ncbi:hypothetical protein MSG28_011925 [Choristoneura fumiferana]|uniref:Uncharacterized protein n=1 Tax=Choristoneura fumiferana TaxID=7141 RepID=A0ACC0KMI7_CHOFU|nr:hypothetical protein MSG28_011925 [Choristoneura fumiferana]
MTVIDIVIIRGDLCAWDGTCACAWIVNRAKVRRIKAATSGAARHYSCTHAPKPRRMRTPVYSMVVDIMKTNVEKVLERDAKLSELDDRADALQYGASQFEQQAKSLKNKFWLQNLKMMIIMGVIGIVIIGLLFGK